MKEIVPSYEASRVSSSILDYPFSFSALSSPLLSAHSRLPHAHSRLTGNECAKMSDLDTVLNAGYPIRP